MFSPSVYPFLWSYSTCKSQQDALLAFSSSFLLWSLTLTHKVFSDNSISTPRVLDIRSVFYRSSFGFPLYFLLPFLYHFFYGLLALVKSQQDALLAFHSFFFIMVINTNAQSVFWQLILHTSCSRRSFGILSFVLRFPLYFLLSFLYHFFRWRSPSP